MLFAAKAGWLLPLSLLAVLASVADGRAQQAQKPGDECVGIVCTLQHRQQEAGVAVPQGQRPREPCVGILCILTGENSEPAGQAAQAPATTGQTGRADDGLAVPHSGLLGSVFSGGDRPQPATPPAAPTVPSAEPAPPEALPAFNGSAQSEIISEGVSAHAPTESAGRRCVPKTNDPWECTR